MGSLIRTTSDGKSIRFRSIDGRAFPHATVARYVAGCRCALCRKALNDRANARAALGREMAESLKPSGPPGEKIVIRKTSTGIAREFKLKTCPGVEGNTCIAGGKWLKSTRCIRLGFCVACAERATIWNGLVSAEPARQHLLALSRKGIGRKTVATACDVAHSALAGIYSGAVTRVRAHTLRRILATDEGCRTEGNRVPAGPTKRIVKQILGRGFTQTWLSRQLGATVMVMSRANWEDKTHVEAGTALKVEKLWRRVKTGDLRPRPRWVPSAPSFVLLRQLLADGFEVRDIEKRLGGYSLGPHTFALTRIRPETAEKIARLHADHESGALEVRERFHDERLRIEDFATARPGAGGAA